MNANEVIANLALAKLGHGRGEYAHLHPNDHVNRSQSVITSYSIHYTKLYDTTRANRRRDLVRA